MKLAYKAFEPGFRCRGYNFKLNCVNVTEKANCAQNGFHCAEDPADCLSYYPDIHSSVFAIVEAGGDIDEDSLDSKISCTELRIRKALDAPAFFLHILMYMAKHKNLRRAHISHGRGKAKNGYVIVSGRDPAASGEYGDILAFYKETDCGDAEQIAVRIVDDETVMSGEWYNTDGEKVSGNDR